MDRREDRREKRHTQGLEALRAAVGERGGQARLADELGVAPAIVSRWMNGDRVPSLDYALALQEALGIDPVLWTRDCEAPTGTEGR